MKQLQLSAVLYGSDSNDFLSANVKLRTGGDTGCNPVGPNWVDAEFASPANVNVTETPVGCATNDFFLGVQGSTGFGVTLIGSIGGYAKAAAVYHCPADKSVDPTRKMARNRSCSMNSYVDGTGLGGMQAPPFRVFKRFSDFGSALSASDCFVLLDENPASINDGWFSYSADGNGMGDRPAINHGNLSSFSYADGHVQLYKWQDCFLTYTSSGSGVDTKWLAQHGTYLK